MVMDEYTTMAVVAVCGIVGGVILSKILFGNDKSKNSPQNINENEIKRWKIDPDWSTMLMGKDPIASATKEYNKLMKLKENNDKEDAELQLEGREGVKKIEAIKDEIESLDSTPLNVAYLREFGLSPAMSKMTRLRKKAQKIVAIDLRYAHHEHFLMLVKSGSKKPGLIQEMDDTIIDSENESPYTKTLEFMERQVAGLTDDEESIARINKALGL